MKNVVFWDITSCGFCKNRRFRGTYLIHHQGDKNRRANVPSPPILVNMMIAAILSSETSVLTRATRRNIPEDGMLQFSLYITTWNGVPRMGRPLDPQLQRFGGLTFRSAQAAPCC
jgi:hypothetical protein